MSHEAWDDTFKAMTLVMSVTSTVVIALIGLAVKQIIGRASDNLHMTSELLKAEIAGVRQVISGVQAELTDHKDTCDKVDKSVLAKQVEILENESAMMRKFAHWIGDGISAIAGKVGVTLQKRPD